MTRATSKVSSGFDNSGLDKGMTGRMTGQKQRNERRRKVLLTAAAATLAGVTLAPRSVRAATVTWAGTIADPNSATYTSTVTGLPSGANLYNWDTTTANWTGAASTYTTGNDVVFTDNFAGGTLVKLPNSP